MIFNIFNYFGRKLPEDQHVTAMASAMREVPGTIEIVEYLTKQFCDNEDSVNGNLPKKLKNYWNQWMSANHGRVIAERTGCAACDGFGAIPFYRDNGEIRYRQIAVCGECENWRTVFSRGHGIPVMTRAAIIANGWELEHIEAAPIPGQTLKRMAMGASKEIPF